jgi:MULE transposase domain
MTSRYKSFKKQLIKRFSLLGKLPSVASLKKTVRRARQEVRQELPNPSRVEKLVIPEEIRKIKKKEDQSGLLSEKFLLYDSGDSDINDSNRIIIFSTEKNLNILSEVEHWFADATFKLSPKLFFQIFTIHAIYINNVMPLVYVLMTNKTKESYLKVMYELIKLRPNLDPSTIMTDFELAMINAFKQVFPNAIQIGYYFHHKQCLLRKMQDERYVLGKYNSNSQFKLKVKMLSALAFVPISDVIATFDELINSELFSD